MQYFNLLNLIRFKTNISEKIIEELLCQQDTDQNKSFSVSYFCKILLVEQNYEIYNAKSLVIVKNFKRWRYYSKTVTYNIFVFINYNNFMKFIKKIRFIS